MAKKKAKKTTNSSGSKKHPLDALKKTTKALGNKAKKAAAKVKNLPKKALHKSVESAEFMALKPVEPLMKLALKKKGVTVPKNAKLKLVASLFVTNVIHNKPSGHLDMESLNYLNALEHVDSEPETKEAATDSAENTAFKAAALVSGIAPGAQAATNIIHMILDFFKGIQKKKKIKQAQEKLKKELIAKGETPEQAEVEAEKKVDSDPDLKLTTEEKKVVNSKTPLTQDEEETAVAVDKTHDELAKAIPGTEDTKGKTHVKEAHTPWYVGFWSRLFSHHASKKAANDEDDDN